MSLAAPAFLLLLALVPLGVLAQRSVARRRRRFAVRYPAALTVAAVAGQASPWPRRLSPALLALAVVAISIALARPHRAVAVPIEQASVVLIMDTSRSMLAEDVSPTRFEAARRAANRFIDRVPDRLQVGVVGFSSTAHTVLDPGLDREAARTTLLSLDPDGGTATGDALQVALDRIEARRGKGRRPPAAIILLSDGKWTAGSDPIPAARRAGQLKVPVYTVALGTPEGILPGGPFSPPTPVPPDPLTLRQISAASGGRAYQVDDADELEGIYQRLGSQIGTRKVKREATAAFAGAGLVLLLAGAAAGLRRRGVLP
jgi:Ca-activated chloride channel family protein